MSLFLSLAIPSGQSFLKFFFLIDNRLVSIPYRAMARFKTIVAKFVVETSCSRSFDNRIGFEGSNRQTPSIGTKMAFARTVRGNLIYQYKAIMLKAIKTE